MVLLVAFLKIIVSFLEVKFVTSSVIHTKNSKRITKNFSPARKGSEKAIIKLFHNFLLDFPKDSTEHSCT